MARQLATIVENNFVGGLNTEATPLKFPPNACTEVSNCMLDPQGRMVRRFSFQYEENATTEQVDLISSEVVTEYLWETAGGDGLVSFLVVQKGNTLYFYDVRESLDISANIAPFTVDLTTFQVDGASDDPGNSLCQFAVGRGHLFVVNRVCDPFFVDYDADAGTITSTSIDIMIRDFIGLDDSIALTARPTETVSSLQTNNPAHYYNLLNQGWAQTDALSQWDTARTDLPSNADTVALYRSSATDAFDTTRVTSQGPGNTPAPKGHFILNAFDNDRETALTDEGFASVDLNTAEVAIPGGSGTIFAGSDTALGAWVEGPYIKTINAFDGQLVTTQSGNGKVAQLQINSGASFFNTTDHHYLGKDFGSNARAISKVTFYGRNHVEGGSGGFYQALDSGGNKTWTLRGNNSTPSGATDGTSLGTVSFTDASNELASNPNGHTITSNDDSTEYRYVWLDIPPPLASNRTTLWINELVMYTPSADNEAISTLERPSSVAFFSGRVFYAGTRYKKLASTVFFSPIIQKNSEYGQCYQANDPTSEELFDLEPSDGGTIVIPDMGQVTRIIGLQTGLMIFANNGIWLVQGSQGQSFRANDYVVKKISDMGTTNAKTFAVVAGAPIWWDDTGIQTVVYDPSYDSYAVKSLSDQTIKTFFLDIPILNRQYAKATVDSVNNIVYWLYNSSDALTEDDYYRYDSVLLFDVDFKSYFPWTIESSANEESIRGIRYVRDANRTLTPKIKYIVTTPVDATHEDLTFAEANGDDYLDWTTEDYDSIFVTGYRLDAQAQRYFQTNYVMVYMTPEANASCFMQGIFEWTTDPATGRWSTAQQIFNADQDSNRVVNHRRLVVRGEGKSAQLRFYSESGKPFTILGWSILESANAGV